MTVSFPALRVCKKSKFTDGPSGGLQAAETTREREKKRHEKILREREKKRTKMGAGEGKKRQILGGPAEGGPEEIGPAEGGPAEGGPAKGWSSGPHTPHTTHNTHTHQHTHTKTPTPSGLTRSGLNSVWA